MKTRSVLFAVLGVGFLLSASAPAFAEWHGGGWHGGWRGDHERWEHRGWGHRGWYPYAYGPRGYYAPPAPYYSYYPYYAPSLNFGVTIP
jgi:hypothetical protein